MKIVLFEMRRLMRWVFLRFSLFIFRERGWEGERKGEKYVQEKHRSVASHTPPTGDLAGNPGMCPDQESNLWPSISQASAQSTDPRQPWLIFSFKEEYSKASNLR